jgi:hypothetical protein
MKFGAKEKYTRAYWEINNPKTTCTCVDDFFIGDELRAFRFTTRSKAICSPQDKFNDEFGKALAFVRCRQKANKKIEKLLIKYSNGNSEKKRFTVWIDNKLYYIEEVK